MLEAIAVNMKRREGMERKGRARGRDGRIDGGATPEHTTLFTQDRTTVLLDLQVDILFIITHE